MTLSDAEQGTAAAGVERGMALVESGRYVEARAEFERALELDPRNAAAWNGLGRVHYNVGTAEEAMDAYERSIALDPHDVHPYYGIGVFLSSRLGDYDGAIAAFERGLAAIPGNPLLTNSIASTYARMGQVDEALARLERARANDPSDSFVLGWLGLLYLHLGRYADSVEVTAHQIELGDAQGGHRTAGYAYMRLGRTEEAMAHLEAAIAAAPDDYEVRGALAGVYRQAGRTAEADKHYRVAREQAEADGEYGLACLASVSGETDQALELLEIGLAKGQVQRGWANIDPEFAFIADDPRFKTLVGA